MSRNPGGTLISPLATVCADAKVDLIINTRPMRHVILSALLLWSVQPLRSQTLPASGVYMITSGRYEVCCGIAGGFQFPLPDAEQSFVRLSVDPQRNTASLSFLAEDMETIYTIIPCPPSGPIPFAFDNGLVFSNRIEFHGDAGPPPYQTSWNYTVSNAADGLRIQGTLGTIPGGCADVPTQFTHTNVVAALVPTVAIRTSEVEICWNSILNRTHQLQYRSALGTNGWTNLGEPLPGDGSTLCVTDKVPAGEPRRFYRVLTLP